MTVERRQLARDDTDDEPYVPVYDSNGREVVEFNGERLPVVREPARPIEQFTPVQQRRIGEAYIRIAQELPTEGRDYEIRFSFPDPDGSPTLAFTALTELGRDYIKHLAKAMRSPNPPQ